MTQYEKAKKGLVTPEVEKVAGEEEIPLDTLKGYTLSGEVVILNNRRGDSLGIGKGLRVKVNANLGTSPEICDLEWEKKRLIAAVEAGADTIMDLSTAGDLDKTRKMFLENCSLPLGTVPVYQAAVESIQEEGSLAKMKPGKIFEVIEKHARDGVDFITVHCGINRKILEMFKNNKRLMYVVSRGGAFHVTWMVATGKENPLYENFDDLLDIARQYDIVLSLGDALRPGALRDSTDVLQIQELLTHGELVERAREKGVQVMVEGPGHVPLSHVEANVTMEKRICKGAPFYVLGPLVTDAALGYDHIACAIGGALACWKGADFLCYVTPGEHIRLPTPEDVKEGVIAARIAAHAGDLARGMKKAWALDNEISDKRNKREWESEIALSLCPEKARAMWEESRPLRPGICSMCGEYCSLKLVEDWLKNES
ncbi:MAG: phosphomethylpyrimidine synthase ThiC [Caldiserica bacterium]|nr:phosphomethylpyrimidine synthase ThiC [Caldisericota bacterium]